MIFIKNLCAIAVLSLCVNAFNLLSGESSLKAEQQEKQDWHTFSLSTTTREMQNEPVLYDISDLKVIYK